MCCVFRKANITNHISILVGVDTLCGVCQRQSREVDNVQTHCVTWCIRLYFVLLVQEVLYTDELVNRQLKRNTILLK